MEGCPLNFELLLSYLHRGIAALEEPREASNARRYSLKDIVLGAFSMFYMQCPSFLEHQRQMQSRQGKNNASQLFGLKQIPTNNQLKNILDQVSAASLFGVFEWVYQALSAKGWLKSYEVLGGQQLVGLDGVEYFSSKKLDCPECSHRTHKNGDVSHHHSAILPVIVAPEKETVIALMPEFIRPQDGVEKQDSEIAAAKRWTHNHQAVFPSGTVTLLGDDLYSHQPMCEHCIERDFNFIFTCLPSSHESLYEWLEYLDKNGEVSDYEERYWNGRYYEIRRYRYVNGIPLRETQPALLVNWCEVNICRESNKKPLYGNAFVTRHQIDDNSVEEIVQAGRARWKTENESHNVLKTKGYHLEHNFGHGQQHLSMTLLTLNWLAFLFHTVLHLADQSYQQIRQLRGTRQGFFQDIRALTRYFLFDSWQHLIDFMLDDTVELSTNTS